jgi:D-alanine-D-alanine ligase
MTPLSLVPEQAAGRGIPYADLVEMLVAEALRVHAAKQAKGGQHGTADPA